ncbi:MAG: AzlD domain-containing protein [Vagococcus sp.]
MEISSYVFVTIVGCALVTWLPRVIPFILAKNMTFSKRTMQFLSFIPMCILTALCVEGLFDSQKGQLTTIRLDVLLASIPTLLIGIYTKSLMWTVMTGVATMGLIRLFL